MDSQEQSPLLPLTTDVNNIPYLFSSSFPPPLMLNNNIFPPVPANLQNPQINLDNIDWASLLCANSNIMDNNTGDQQQQQQQMPQVLSEGDQNSGWNININNIGNYKGKNSRSKKSIPPRVAFHTRSSENVLDDGYRWRKYGQKAVKNSIHPRSYYRCTHHTCNVKKQIQRLSKDTSIVVTTYDGIHNHPCEKLMETLTPLLKQIQFLSRF